MSKAQSGASRLNRWARGCKHIFWQATDEDINPTMSEDKDDNSVPFTRGTDDSGGMSDTRDGGGSEDSSITSIDAGKRSPRWFERTERVMKENRNRSIQNQNLLQRVDFRTVWIARLLIALLTSILGALILQIYL